MAAPRVYPVLTPEQVALFWAKIDRGPANQCWPWTAAKKGGGYGALRVNKQPLVAHRVAWELTHGPVPLNQRVYHVVCNDHGCCNPSHLALGNLSTALSSAVSHGTKMGRATHTPAPCRVLAQVAKPYPTLTAKQLVAFWAKVDKRGASECWPWTAAGSGNYGAFKAGGRQLRASRMAYKLAFGEPPLDLAVCHRCDNPPCCNPDHLFIGTQRVNSQDAVRKGRGNHARGEAAGKAVFVAEQVYEIRLRADCGEQRKHIAARFSVTEPSISAIALRRSWKHLPERPALIGADGRPNGWYVLPEAGCGA